MEGGAAASPTVSVLGSGAGDTWHIWLEREVQRLHSPCVYPVGTLNYQYLSPPWLEWPSPCGRSLAWGEEGNALQEADMGTPPLECVPECLCGFFIYFFNLGGHRSPVAFFFFQYLVKIYEVWLFIPQG